TDVFQRGDSGLPRDVPACSPWFFVRARIINGGLVMQVVYTRAGVSLNDVQLLGMRVTGGVKPRLIVEAGVVYHHGVSFPVADPLPKVSGIIGRIGRVGASIGIDDPPHVGASLVHEDQAV